MFLECEVTIPSGFQEPEPETLESSLVADHSNVELQDISKASCPLTWFVQLGLDVYRLAASIRVPVIYAGIRTKPLDLMKQSSGSGLASRHCTILWQLETETRKADVEPAMVAYEHKHTSFFFC